MESSKKKPVFSQRRNNWQNTSWRTILSRLKKVAFIINKYFKHKIEKLKNKLPNPTNNTMKLYMKHIKTPIQLLSFKTINISQTWSIISSLKNSNSCAKDGVSNKMINMIIESISPLILHLINTVITQN